MDFTDFYAGPDDEDRRLDRIIRKFSGQESLSGLYKAIRKGLVKVNDKKTESSSHVHNGDKISIASFLLADAENSKFSCKDVELSIILETEDLLFINKPYDVTVHGSSSSLDVAVQNYYNKKTKSNGSLSFKPGPLHRLDRKTTGILCFSMSLKGARWFSENIANHSIHKTYQGIVQGHLSKEEHWIDFISKDFDSDKSFQTVTVNSVEDGEKSADTVVTPLGYGKLNGIDYTLVRFVIKTGRTHQIRAQSAFHGHPLLGDTAYGGKEFNFSQDFFLHAVKLDLPADNLLSLPSLIEAPLPDVFQKFIDQTLSVKI